MARISPFCYTVAMIHPEHKGGNGMDTLTIVVLALVALFGAECWMKARKKG